MQRLLKSLNQIGKKKRKNCRVVQKMDTIVKKNESIKNTRLIAAKASWEYMNPSSRTKVKKRAVNEGADN